jgi:hypothetical protein
VGEHNADEQGFMDGAVDSGEKAASKARELFFVAQMLGLAPCCEAKLRIETSHFSRISP